MRRRKLTNELCIEGKRVSLRPLKPSDFEQWAEVRAFNTDWLLSWEPTRDTRFPEPSTDFSAFENRCDAWQMESEYGRGQQLGIFIGEEGEKFIGEVNVSSIQRGVLQSCSVGYWVDQREAGKGYVPESVVVVFRHAFDELRLHRVQIAIVPRNQPSLRVVEKLELRQEGLAERYLEINGTWEDHNIYALTLEEYEERRGQLLSSWILREPARS